MKNNFEWKDFKNFSILKIDGLTKFQIEWVPEISRFIWCVCEAPGKFFPDHETEKELSKIFPNFRKKSSREEIKEIAERFFKNQAFQ